MNSLARFIAIVMILSAPGMVSAQQAVITTFQFDKDRPKELREHRFKMNSGKLSLKLTSVVIEGYEGDEVIISTRVELPEEVTDPRAAGLKRMNRSGLEDNTGLALTKTQDGQVTTIQRIKPSEKDSIFIKIPKHLDVEIIKSDNILPSEGDISIKNVSGEVEVSPTRGNVFLMDITGPATVTTVYGNIEAIFSDLVNGPVSLITHNGYVDVALPSRTKADIELSTVVGEIFADESFRIDRDLSSKELTAASFTRKIVHEKGSASYPERVTVTGTFPFNLRNRVKGTLNGGGQNIIVNTTNGKIYLRRAD